MKLANSFVVESPLAQVWSLFDELERVVPCMPGAAYLGMEAGEHRVSMRVKIGAIVSNFQGTVTFVQKDDAAHVAVMRGAAKDAGGKGSASALIETRLAAIGPHQTQVDVGTDLSMTGRLAQFGGPIVADIAQRLIQQFTANLHQEVLAHAPPPPAAPAQEEVAAVPPPTAAPVPQSVPREVAPLDLGAVVGASLLQNAGRFLLPLAIGLVLGWLAGRYW